MSIRLTTNAAEWVDILENPPQIGSKILGLTHGGKLVECIYSKDSFVYLDAYCAYPKVPQIIRDRQAARFKF